MIVVQLLIVVWLSEYKTWTTRPCIGYENMKHNFYREKSMQDMPILKELLYEPCNNEANKCLKHSDGKNEIIHNLIAFGRWKRTNLTLN